MPGFFKGAYSLFTIDNVNTYSTGHQHLTDAVLLRYLQGSLSSKLRPPEEVLEGIRTGSLIEWHQHEVVAHLSECAACTKRVQIFQSELEQKWDKKTQYHPTYSLLRRWHKLLANPPVFWGHAAAYAAIGAGLLLAVLISPHIVRESSTSESNVLSSWIWGILWLGWGTVLAGHFILTQRGKNRKLGS